jgi:hypothetical protein
VRREVAPRDQPPRLTPRSRSGSNASRSSRTPSRRRTSCDSPYPGRRPSSPGSVSSGTGDGAAGGDRRSPISTSGLMQRSRDSSCSREMRRAIGPTSRDSTSSLRRGSRAPSPPRGPAGSRRSAPRPGGRARPRAAVTNALPRPDPGPPPRLRSCPDLSHPSAVLRNASSCGPPGPRGALGSVAPLRRSPERCPEPQPRPLPSARCAGPRPGCAPAQPCPGPLESPAYGRPRPISPGTCHDRRFSDLERPLLPTVRRVRRPPGQSWQSRRCRWSRLGARADSPANSRRAGELPSARAATNRSSIGPSSEFAEYSAAAARNCWVATRGFDNRGAMGESPPPGGTP